MESKQLVDDIIVKIPKTLQNIEKSLACSGSTTYIAGNGIYEELVGINKRRKTYSDFYVDTNCSNQGYILDILACYCDMSKIRTTLINRSSIMISAKIHPKDGKGLVRIKVSLPTHPRREPIIAGNIFVSTMSGNVVANQDAAEAFRKGIISIDPSDDRKSGIAMVGAMFASRLGFSASKEFVDTCRALPKISMVDALRFNAAQIIATTNDLDRAIEYLSDIGVI